jgi:hypothetical protein
MIKERIIRDGVAIVIEKDDGNGDDVVELRGDWHEETRKRKLFYMRGVYNNCSIKELEMLLEKKRDNYYGNVWVHNQFKQNDKGKNGWVE